MLRHLKALIYDEDCQGDFNDPVNLAIVEWIIKCSFNSESGVVPIFAEYGGLDDDYLTLPDLNVLPPDEAAQVCVKYVRDKLLLYRGIIAKTHELVHKKRTQDNSTANYFQPGDYVFVKNYKKSYKTQPRKLGPYEVIKHDENDTNNVHMRNIVDGKLCTYPVIDCCICPIANKEKIIKIARLDQQQFEVSEILAYKGNPSLRSTMEYLVRFKDLDEIWRPHTDDLTTTSTWEQFASNIPRLTGLTITADEQRKRVALINKQKIVFGPGQVLHRESVVYIDLRSWGHEWYAQLDLPSAHRTTYVVQCNFTGVTKNNTKIDLQCPSLTGSKKFEMPHIFLTDECIWTFDESKHVLVDAKFIAKYPQVLSDSYMREVKKRKQKGTDMMVLVSHLTFQ